MAAINYNMNSISTKGDTIYEFFFVKNEKECLQLNGQIHMLVVGGLANNQKYFSSSSAKISTRTHLHM